MIEPTDEMLAAFLAAWDDENRIINESGAEFVEVGQRDRAGLTAVLAIVFRPHPHLYLSTGCLHGTEEGHAFCRLQTRRYDGSTKTAGTCKFCPARCVCPCHGEAS